MLKNYKFTVPDVHTKQRIDKYVSQFIESISRTRVQKCINLGFLTVNGDLVKSNYIVKPDDEIDLDIPISEKQNVTPEDIPLDIVFEDNFLMVVNKPAGMVTHPGYSNYNGTLVNAVLFHSQKSNDSLSSLNGFERAGIVHRLDKDTSGLLVIAKDEVTHRKLSDQFFHHTIEREYNAIVWGRFKNPSGTIEAKIGRDKRDRKKMAVIPDDEAGGKEATTIYEVVQEFELFTLVKLNLKTGRTHQIRVHMSNKNHPVFGDDTYGGRKPQSKLLSSKLKAHFSNLLDIMPRQALHARLLGFIHPVTSEHLRFESELPDDMKALMEKLM